MSLPTFREAAAAKGWSMANLAYRWGIYPESLSRIANNPRRDPWWNDALAGLPSLTAKEAREITEQRLRAKPPKPRQRKSSDLSADQAGYRYHDDLEPGAIVILTGDMGAYPEGSEGIVKERAHTGRGEKYLIAFDGYADWYGPDDIDRLMVATGRMSGGISEPPSE